MIERALRGLPGSPLRRLSRLSLLGQFGLLSAVAILGLGLALGLALNHVIEQRALATASGEAEVVARLGVQPLLTPTDMGRGFGPERIAELDQALAGNGLVGTQVARINIWSRDHRILYSSDHNLIGHSFPTSDELEDALSGKVASDLETPTKEENASLARLGRVLEVYVPLRFGQSGAPTGAFELYLPYAPIAATTAQDTLSLFAILAVGLLVLYALLFRIVAQASNRLRRQTEELRQQASLREYQAQHDALTDLPNRNLFHDRLEVAVKRAAESEAVCGVLMLDVDRFKEINDTLGHQNGDRLLQAIGERLQTAVSNADLVARLGGDEFAVLVSAAVDRAHCVQVAEKLLNALAEPFTLADVPLDVQASVGIALFPEDGDRADLLLQRADVAMYVAKAQKSRIEAYARDKDTYAPARLSLVAELRRALERRELLVYYQPKVALPAGELLGVEALVRWPHPELGMLGPDRFIPLAENTGLIRELTVQVLENALRQARRWEEEGTPIPVAVNLSARSLLDAGFPDQVEDLLRRTRLDPGRLELEITESTIMADPVRASEVVARLHAMGIRLAVDDFGTGYSSLSYLRQLPIAGIKIDKSFVLQMRKSENDAVIVRSIIDLGRNLGLEVVAEGVETAEVFAELAGRGCAVAQGFYISRPVPAEQIGAWRLNWLRRDSQLAA